MTKPIVVRSIETAPGVLHVDTECGRFGPVGAHDPEKLADSTQVKFEISADILTGDEPPADQESSRDTTR
jgi:hypothetical protein